MEDTPEERRKRRKAGRLGCGVIALIILAVLVGLGYHFLRPVREAKRVEQTLNERFAWATEFTPAADGAVAPERMEAFVRVRQRVAPHCRSLQTVLDEVLELDALEDREDLPDPAVLQEAFGSFRQLFGAGSRFLRFINARNNALLEEEMGLGEYLYIYVLAYREPLGQAADSRYAQLEEAHVSDRTREELTQILRNQLEALTAGGEPSSDPGRTALATTLRAQIAALEEDRLAFPWQDGHPAAISASLAPYADRLGDLYCEGLVKVELLQKNKGLKFRG